MCKIHAYKDPDQQPTLYEELEENKVYTPGYNKGTYKQITPYPMNDESEQAGREKLDSGINTPEVSDTDGSEKEGEPTHGERDSAGNIYQRNVGEYVSEEMFAYLNELVCGDEGDNEQEKGLSILPDFLEGKGGIIKQGVPFFTTEGGPEPTKFKAQHTCLPVNLDEFFPAAGGIGAGVKPVKLRLPLAKAISKITGAIREANTVKDSKEVKQSIDDKTENTKNKTWYQRDSIAGRDNQLPDTLYRYYPNKPDSDTSVWIKYNKNGAYNFNRRITKKINK